MFEKVNPQHPDKVADRIAGAIVDLCYTFLAPYGKGAAIKQGLRHVDGSINNNGTMKKEDLMVGDWVYNKHHKKNIQITPYDFFTHGHLPSGSQYFIGEPELVSGRDLEPIPLTYEFLRKIFPNTNDGVYWYGRKGKYEVTMVHGENRIKVLIEYVHELQHALRLCGIEKEIEL